MLLNFLMRYLDKLQKIECHQKFLIMLDSDIIIVILSKRFNIEKQRKYVLEKT